MPLQIVLWMRQLKCRGGQGRVLGGTDIDAGWRGAGRGSFVCAVAGGLSGVGLYLVLYGWPAPGSSHAHLLLEWPVWAVVVGFCLGFVAGGWIGGCGGQNHLINMPLRELWQRLAQFTKTNLCQTD